MRDYFASIHPVGRMAPPKEIAAAVLYLCSDNANSQPASSLVVDGGFPAQINKQYNAE